MNADLAGPQERAAAFSTADGRSLPAFWQSMESAPKDGTYILVTNERAKSSWIARWHPAAASGYRFEQPWRSVMLNHDHIPLDVRHLPPTHWMPLPAAAPSDNAFL
jgi:hypothetical protein